MKLCLLHRTDVSQEGGWYIQLGTHTLATRAQTTERAGWSELTCNGLQDK